METNFLVLKKILYSLYNDLESIKIIVELGARDCKETLHFEENYPNANILTFECNPATLNICRKAVIGKSRISLFEKAVSDTNGTIKFYPVNPEMTETTWEDGNPGASSLFKASGNYEIENYVQDEIIVDTVRLDNILRSEDISEVDLLWMDIQGAELMALKGLGKTINNIKVIHTEVEFIEIYTNQPLFEEIKSFLINKNFQFVGFTTQHQFAGDAVFLNQAYFNNQLLNQVAEMLKKDDLNHIEKRFFQSIKRFLGMLWKH